MHRFRRIAGVMAASTAVVVSTVGATAAHAHNSHNNNPPAPESSCFWSSEFNATTANGGFPNGGPELTNYWYNTFTLPAGAKVVLHGRYPEGRYMSFGSYYSVPNDPTQRGIPSDSLYDQQIAPDPGSTNPFRSDAKRTSSKRRDWTAVVSPERPPADPAQRAANTLYAGTKEPDQAQPVELLYRVYVHDKHADITGDAGLPQATLVLADGTELTGQAACDQLGVSTAAPAANRMPLAQYVQLTNLPAVPAAGRPGSSKQAPATDPARWYRPINACHFTDPFFEAAGYPVATCPATPALTQWPTKDNAYITAYVDRSFGPAADGHNVVVMTGKMPTTVATNKNSAHGRHHRTAAQLRYWGVCSNESMLTTRVTLDNGCAYDEQIPVDRQGRYTIVVSTPEDRPANATKRCGVTWINWGAGDGAPAPYTRPTSAMLIVRNLLPDASFTQAAQNIPAPGLPAQVAATMGDYLPSLAYQSRVGFEAGGCK